MICDLIMIVDEDTINFHSVDVIGCVSNFSYPVKILGIFVPIQVPVKSSLIPPK